MPDNWRQIAIGALCDQGIASIQTGPFGSQLHAEDYRSTGTPVIPTEAIGRRRIEHIELPRVGGDTVLRLARHKLVEGDILFARRGAQATGNSALIENSHVGALCGTGAILLRIHDKKQVNPKYLSFALAAPTATQWLRDHAVGAVMPNLNSDLIRRLELPLPDLRTQETIADILGTLDDKIELNRQMNETLEAMARALFKSWFVDFDPVRAKAAGRAPVGMDVETAKLFPSEFVDSELGPIPKGWGVTTLGRYADLNSESWSRANWPESIRYVDLSGTKRGAIESVSTFDRSSAPIRAQRVLRLGDTIVGTVRPGNGSFALVDCDGLTGSTGFAVLRPKFAEARAFVYCAATTSANIERLAHLADGGAYPAVRPELVLNTQTAGASTELVGRFENAVVSLIKRIGVNRAESATLVHLRDELLPRLLSGELGASLIAGEQGDR